MIPQQACTTSAQSDGWLLFTRFIDSWYNRIIHHYILTPFHLLSVRWFFVSAESNEAQQALRPHRSLVSISTRKKLCFTDDYHPRSQQCFKSMSSKKSTFEPSCIEKLCVCMESTREPVVQRASDWLQGREVFNMQASTGQMKKLNSILPVEPFQYCSVGTIFLVIYERVVMQSECNPKSNTFLCITYLQIIISEQNTPATVPGQWS